MKSSKLVSLWKTGDQRALKAAGAHRSAIWSLYPLCALVLLCGQLLSACGASDAPRSPAMTVVAPATTVTSAAAPTTLVRPSATSVPTQPSATSAPMQIIITMEATFAPLVIAPAITPTTTIIPLTIREQVLQVELATTYAQRNEGYMGRSTIPDGTGMLFVFANDQQLSFWMRDTPTPLSIAFVDAQKHILNIVDMQPFDDTTIHKSLGLARYALEVPQGWFTTHGIQAGDTLEFTLPDGITIE